MFKIYLFVILFYQKTMRFYTILITENWVVNSLLLIERLTSANAKTIFYLHIPCQLLCHADYSVYTFPLTINLPSSGYGLICFVFHQKLSVKFHSKYFFLTINCWLRKINTKINGTITINKLIMRKLSAYICISL